MLEIVFDGRHWAVRSNYQNGRGYRTHAKFMDEASALRALPRYEQRHKWYIETNESLAKASLQMKESDGDN